MSAAAPSPDPAAVLDVIRSALPEAARAPSAHNTQPARWTVDEGGRAVLLEDPSRWLSRGDPTRRDHILSLGAAWEALDLALSRRGLGLGTPERVARGPRGRAPDTAGGAPRKALRPMLRARVVLRRGPDPLAEAIWTRRTWRGRFPLADPGRIDAVRRTTDAFPGTAWVTDPAAVARWADRYDACLVEALSPPVLRELRAWTKLSSDEVQWARDGLTAPTLRIPGVVAPLAGQLLRPSAFALLRACGLARTVVSEAAATRSASGLLVLHRRRDEALLACGRRFYRLWLTLAASGFAACPMSALLDVPRGVAALRKHATGTYEVPFAVLRVGPTPSRPVPVSPRLPPEALLVDPGALS